MRQRHRRGGRRFREGDRRHRRRRAAGDDEAGRRPRHRDARVAGVVRFAAALGAAVGGVCGMERRPDIGDRGGCSRR